MALAKPLDLSKPCKTPLSPGATTIIQFLCLVLVSAAALAILGTSSTTGPQASGVSHHDSRLRFVSRLPTSILPKGFFKAWRTGDRGREERGEWKPTGEGVAWVPSPDKFLLAYCFRGQVSNRNLCLKNHFLLAGLLNRTLLVPFDPDEQGERAYDLRLRWDLDRTRRCLGDDVIMTTREFREAWREKARRGGTAGGAGGTEKGAGVPSATVGPPTVQVQCWQGPPQVCGAEHKWLDKDLNCPAAVATQLQLGVAALGGPTAAAAGAGAEPSMHLDTASQLYKLLGPFPEEALATKIAARGKNSSAAATTEFGLRGVFGWKRVKASPQDPMGIPGLSVGASCLGMTRSLSSALLQLRGLDGDILVVGDLVERKMESPVLAGGKLEHVFLPARDQQGADCSWTVLVPPRPMQALASEVAAIVRRGGAACGGDLLNSSLCGGEGGLTTPGLSREAVQGLVGTLGKGGGKGGSNDDLSHAAESGQGALGQRGPRGFLTIHWRRGDFIQYCFTSVESDACTYGPRQAANCTVQQARKHGLRNVFLATNAEPAEVKLFQEAVDRASGGSITIHTLSNSFLTVKAIGAWLESTVGVNATQQGKFAKAILEKLIAARGSIFLGSVESTFTKDIMDMRRRLGTWNYRDTFLCNKQQEWDDDQVNVPKWMVEHKRLRRWKSSYKRGRRVGPREKKMRDEVLRIVGWLEWRAWKKADSPLPGWFESSKVWQKWKHSYADQEGLSKEEKELRQWIVSHYESLEYTIKSTLTKAAKTL